MVYIETSAKIGENVDHVYVLSVAKAVQRLRGSDLQNWPPRIFSTGPGVLKGL